MNIYYYIMPRRSGKTTIAFNRAYELAHDYKVIYLTADYLNKNAVIRKGCHHNLRIMNVQSFYSNSLYDFQCDYLFIDEYLIFSKEDKCHIYDILNRRNISSLINKDVYIYTTSDKIYNETLLSTIRNRVFVTVLRETLLKQLDNGAYEPKVLKREMVKEVLLSFRRALQETARSKCKEGSLTTFNYI